MPTALIDGDIVAFRAAAACQVGPYDFGDVKSEAFAAAEEAAEAACQTIEAWAALARCKDVIVCFTGRENFRKRILPSYKSNRAGAVKPLAYMATVDAIKQRFPNRLVDGLEGDDLIGILATTERFLEGQAVMVTLDKDMRGVPGVYFNPVKMDRPEAISLLDADHFWLKQALMGDRTDGYTGIPRVGRSRADKILGGPRGPAEYLWPSVVKAYQAHKLTEQDALTQARVARILRREDYDKDTKTIRLWHPNTPELLPLLHPETSRQCRLQTPPPSPSTTSRATESSPGAN